ncbi:MAG: thiaminase II [Geminicoccaceae bacterium]|nr:thiaminase II [Geminicoccaceae bacterium]
MTKLRLVAADGLAGRLIQAAGPAWDAYAAHPFVDGIKDGTLPGPSFRRYLVQDYLFLVHFGRAWALAAAKSVDLDDLRACAATLHALVDEEIRLHVRYCAGFGLDEASMAATPEHGATMAYTRYVLAKGGEGDLLDLLVALAPCVVGYGEIAARIEADPTLRLDGNPYREWIETYAAPDYVAVVRAAEAQLDRAAARRLGPTPQASPRWADLVRTFTDACRLEADFWAMGLDG